MLTHFNLGVLYRDKNQSTKALESFRNSLKVNPYYPEAHFQMALTYLDKKDKESARLSAEQAAQSAPGNKKYQDLLARIQTS